MAPTRKSSHESVLNCCDTILQLYSVFVFRIVPPPYRPVCFTHPWGVHCPQRLTHRPIREATEPRRCTLIINFVPGNAEQTNSIVPSVQPSAVIRISNGRGSSCFNTSHVRIECSTRFFVEPVLSELA